MNSQNDEIPNCTITKVHSKHNTRFNAQEHVYSVNFAPEFDAVNNIHGVMAKIYRDAFEDAPRNSRVGITISHPEFPDGNAGIHLKRIEDADPADAVQLLEEVSQSNQEIPLSDMKIEAKRIDPVAVAGKILANHPGRRNVVLDPKEYILKRYNKNFALQEIKNNDQRCLLRAVVTAIAREHRNDSLANNRRFLTIRKGDSDRRSAQRQEAILLARRANLSTEGPYTLEDIKEVQNVLTNDGYQIRVWQIDMAASLVYCGPSATYKINILVFENHAYVINSVPKFLQCRAYCFECDTPYDHDERHICTAKCPRCRVLKHRCQKENERVCTDCNRWFPSRPCFEAHKQGNGRGQSTCDKLRICKCGVGLQKGANHTCGDRKCQYCNLWIEKSIRGHNCFIQPLSLKSLQKQQNKVSKFIFFDFESLQKRIGPADYEHMVGLIVVQQISDKCSSNWTRDDKCANCGEHELVFEGAQSLRQFSSWLFSETNRNAIGLSHYGSGYDHILLCKDLLDRGVPPTIINSGLRLISMELNGVILKDSFKYMPFSLEKMASAFKLEVRKGYFPYLFYKRANLDYVGPYPSTHYYCVDTMKPERRAECLKWLEEQQGKTFNLREEALAYCRNDVDILREGCMLFRNNFIKETKVDPFSNATTIASSCNKVFLLKHLKEKTIGLIPIGGYRQKVNQSVSALKWMEWMNLTQGLEIDHIGNAVQEFRVGPYTVDGFDPNTNTVYEFNGCVWHGHDKCKFNREKKVPNSNITMEDAFRKTMDRKKYIENEGYNVVFKWSCELAKDLRKNRAMKTTFDRMKIIGPLNPRDALFGGRCGATKLYYKFTAEEIGRLADFVSLYPTVNKKDRYPIGHPDVLTKNLGNDITIYFGVAKVKVVPPRGLFHPVLPLKIDKLYFPLCSICPRHKTKVCNHSREERSWIGTYVTEELKVAVSHGYEIEAIYEVYHYNETRQLDENTKGLFSDYINQFLAAKVEATGWPSGCESEEDKAQYIQSYKETENLTLDSSKIESNPARRELAKLCLNSFWGKFGQRGNMGCKKFFNNVKELNELIYDDEIIVDNFHIMSDTVIQVEYHQVMEYVKTNPITSSVIAAFTTAYGRLRLYKILEVLQEDAYYLDTDSCLFRENRGEQKVRYGNFLGDFKDEISNNEKIIEFVSGGSKNYGYKLENINTGNVRSVVKIKGLTLNHQAGIDFINLRFIIWLVKSKI